MANRVDALKLMKTEKKYIKQKELSALLNVGSTTIKKWHQQGCPRIYISVRTSGHGSCPRYNVDDVCSWLKSRTSGKGVEA